MPCLVWVMACTLGNKVARHSVGGLDRLAGWVKLCLVGPSHRVEIGGSSGAVHCTARESLYSTLE